MTPTVVRRPVAALVLAAGLAGCAALAGTPAAPTAAPATPPTTHPAIPAAVPAGHPHGAEAHPVLPACTLPTGWVRPADGAPVPGPEVLDTAAGRAVVLLGEHHDDADHHRWQLQALAALHARRPDLVIGFEAFPRRVQPALDRWVNGELTPRELLAATDWAAVWGVDAELYLPLFEFARINRVPMLALNVDRALNKAVVARGWAAIPETEREGVSDPAPPPAAYRDSLFAVWREHAPADDAARAAATPDDPAFARFVQSQLLWDRAMAEPLARVARAADAPLAVGILGSGHVQHGHGVPHQLRALGVDAVTTLLPIDGGPGCPPLAPDLADAVFVLPARPTAPHPPPRLGVMLEDDDGAVTVTQVVDGSLAQRTGLAVGDRLVEVAGAAPDGVGGVIDAIRRQPAGTWLPLRVRRGSEELDLVVRFPPAK